jgi:phosphonate transport system permease protein
VASPVPPSRLFRRNLAVVVVGSAALVIAGIGLGFRPWMLVTEFHHLVRLAGEMLPPNVALLWRKPGLFETIGTTLAMTFLGTVTGCLLAFVLALVAARNTTLHPALRSATRLLFGLERATPNFVVLLVLFISFGYGPFAAMIALAIGSIGMFGKLFADAIEEVEAGPCEAVELVGAGRSSGTPSCPRCCRSWWAAPSMPSMSTFAPPSRSESTEAAASASNSNWR